MFPAQPDVANLPAPAAVIPCKYCEKDGLRPPRSCGAPPSSLLESRPDQPVARSRAGLPPAPGPANQHRTRRMIQVDNITKFFGPVLAVDHVSFEVNKGEIVGFLGPNGAGKTTTMRILTTWMPATSGVASVAGFDIMNQSLEVRRNIGYLPDTVPLYPEMRVEEYLSYRAKLKGVERKQRPKRIEHVLEHFRIREVRRRLIGTLSHGYRQRVGLADALIHNPPILILDEPTGGLDPLQIRETLKTIRNLRGQHTILLSTHILSQVEDACDRVIIINRGRIGLDKRLSDLAAERPTILVEIRGPREQVLHALEATDGVE